jgi:sugar phosphate isomerase/epimerase
MRHMAFTRAFSTIGCPAYSLDQVLELAARHRIDAVELRSLSGTTDLPSYFEGIAGTPSVLADRMRMSSVRIIAFATSLRLIGGSTQARDDFLRFLPWAEALGGIRLRVFDGGAHADECELAEAADTLAWWQSQRIQHGWRSDLMVETHDSLLTASAMKRFLVVAPVGTSILWDTHHTWKKSGEAPVDTWMEVKTHIVHLHIKDSIDVASDGLPFTYVPSGTGKFPFAALAAKLRADNYTGPVSLEWEKMWHPSLPSLDEALEATNLAWW